MSMTKLVAVLATTAALSATVAFADPPRDDDHRPQQESRQDSKGDAHHDSMKGPSIQGPSTQGPSMKGPSMQGPRMQGPSARKDSMHGPDIGNERAWHDDRGVEHRDHDRYWRQGFNGFAPRDRIFSELRKRHYDRFSGDPYWYQGRYVVRSFDRSGRPIFIEINPYTGSFVGVVRF